MVCSSDRTKQSSLLGKMDSNRDGAASSQITWEDNRAAKSSVRSTSGQENVSVREDSLPASSGCRELSPSRDWGLAQSSGSPSVGEKDSPFGHLKLLRASSLPTKGEGFSLWAFEVVKSFFPSQTILFIPNFGA